MALKKTRGRGGTPCLKPFDLSLFRVPWYIMAIASQARTKANFLVRCKVPNAQDVGNLGLLTVRVELGAVLLPSLLS